MKTPRISDFDPDAKARALKSPLEGMPTIEKPAAKNRLDTPNAAEELKQNANTLKGNSTFFADYSPTSNKGAAPDVPLGVPPPVRGPVPRTPKVKRPIRQRQPFDIFEDQYARLKQIADAEREFVDGRGMSQMVREAIDMYLKEHFSSTE